MVPEYPPVEYLHLYKKYSVSPSRTIDLVSLYSIIIALIIFVGILYDLRICASFAMCIESKALEKYTNIRLSTRLFSLTPSSILLTVRMCPTVDLLFLKQFVFGLRILSRVGCIIIYFSRDAF